MPEGVEGLRIAGGAGGEGVARRLSLQERLGGRGFKGLLCWTDAGPVTVADESKIVRPRLVGKRAKS